MSDEKNKSGDLMPPKKFVGVIVLDYRSGAMRITKNKPTKLKSFEIPIRIELEVTAPKIPDIVARGKLQIDPVKVNEMFMEMV